MAVEAHFADVWAGMAEKTTKLPQMLRSYFKTAWRNLRRNKTYSAINISGLAIALAAFWMIVLYIADELSYDRYNTHAGRIVRLVQHTRWNGNEMHQVPTSAPFAPALKAAFPQIEDAVRIDLEGGGVISFGNKKIKQDDLLFADKSLLNIFTYQFIYGNANDALAAPQSMVITRSLANKLFGSVDQAMNQTVYIDNNVPNKITAVIEDIPANSHLRFSAARSFDGPLTGGWQNFYLYTYLLLKEGVNYQDFQAQLPAFADTNIKSIMKVNDYQLELQPLTSIHLHSNLAFEIGPNGSINRVYMFIAIAALILIIAVINYMNLATARSSSRVKEIGVRKVIGSGKRNIAGMLVAEALLVTLLAATTAVLLVRLFMPWFNVLTGKELSLWRFGVVTTLLVLFLFSVVMGVVSGLYPAFFLAAFKTIPALKGQMGNRNAGIRFRKSLVVFQFVITVVMISCSLIIYRQLQFALHKDLGFTRSQVLTFHIDDRSVRDKLAAVKARLRQSPLIEQAAAAGNPIGNNNLGGLSYRFETDKGDFNTATTNAQELMVDEDFLATTGIGLQAGRNFSAGIQTDKYGAALINETLMKKLGWKNAIGKRMRFPIDDKGAFAERTIIGVVKDFHTYSLQYAIDPLVMVMPPVSSMEDNLYVRFAKGKTKEGLAYLNHVYHEFDAANTAEYSFLDQNFARQYGAEEKQGKVAAVFTFLAVLIACLGLFGLATFAAAQRTKEIGIRKVLGASVAHIIQLFSKEFVVLVMIASVIAIPLAWILMNRWLEGFAYRTTVQWWLLLLPGVVVGLFALFTIGFHAVKIALANPVKSLRNE